MKDLAELSARLDALLAIAKEKGIVFIQRQAGKGNQRCLLSCVKEPEPLPNGDTPDYGMTAVDEVAKKLNVSYEEAVALMNGWDGRRESMPDPFHDLGKALGQKFVDGWQYDYPLGHVS